MNGGLRCLKVGLLAWPILSGVGWRTGDGLEQRLDAGAGCAVGGQVLVERRSSGCGGRLGGNRRFGSVAGQELLQPGQMVVPSVVFGNEVPSLAAQLLGKFGLM